MATNASGMETNANKTTIGDVNDATKTPFQSVDFFIAVIIVELMFMVMVTIFIGVALFYCTASKEPRGKFTNRTPDRLLLLCVIGLFIALLRNIVNQVVAFIGWRNTKTCSFGVKLSYSLYFICMMSIFVFLWYRLKIFYSDSLLQYFLHSSMVFGYRLALLLAIVGGIILIVLFVFPKLLSSWDFAASPLGCRNISENSNLTPKLLMYFNVFLHIFMLLLFVYPLISSETKPFNTSKEITGFDADLEIKKSRSNAKSERSAVYESTEGRGQLQLRLEWAERVVGFIRKMCLISLICIGVDAIILTIPLFLHVQSELLYLSILDINLLSYEISNLLTFNEWRHILLPLCFKRKKAKRVHKQSSKKDGKKDDEKDDKKDDKKGDKKKGKRKRRHKSDMKLSKSSKAKSDYKLEVGKEEKLNATITEAVEKRRSAKSLKTSSTSQKPQSTVATYGSVQFYSGHRSKTSGGSDTISDSHFTWFGSDYVSASNKLTFVKSASSSDKT